MVAQVATQQAKPLAGDLDRPPCGSGVILCIDQDTDTLLAIPTYCHRWDCEPCARANVARIRAMAAAGKPTRILTLTTRPRPFLPVDVAVRWIRKCQRKLFAKIRKEFGNTPYMSFLEFHKSGWPHLHILLRGAYIPQRMLSDWWLQISGSFKVHVQQVSNTWKGVQEATKYYLKSAATVNEHCPAAPVYSKSRDWLPDDWNASDRPEGSFKFFAFCRLPWEAALGTLEDLGATIVPSADNARHVEIHMCGPPDPDASRGIEACGDFGELELLSALQAIATSSQGLATAVNELQDTQHYLAHPWAYD